MGPGFLAVIQRWLLFRGGRQEGSTVHLCKLYILYIFFIYREAEESGKRQREERLRRTEDEIFKQMMRVHTGSVEAYLEDVILASTERTADEQARQEIQKQAQAINQVAHEFQHT